MARLSEEQVAELRRRLEARREELREEIRRELEASEDQGYIDLAGQVHDSGDASVADLLKDVEVALVDRQVQEIREVEAALQRIHTGAYGICEDCGGDIGYERLRAQPTARRCALCQEQWERRQAQQPGAGAPSL
ncbi:MAG: TraR/DksA family transcriptional regulator [Gammaproteobacteria bacterium]|nr:MAG: TraR/DksA family transcriptional regulator [Gammaproteobacteria bacterium]